MNMVDFLSNDFCITKNRFLIRGINEIQASVRASINPESTRIEKEIYSSEIEQNFS